MRVSSSRHDSASAWVPVTNSSWDSLKSVVMCGWVSAEPSASGCGVRASLPSACVRRLSFSRPRRMPCSVAGDSARRRSCRLLTLLSSCVIDPKGSRPGPLAPARVHGPGQTRDAQGCRNAGGTTTVGSSNPTRSHRQETCMDMKLHLLETFAADGADGAMYKVHGYERLARDETLADGQDHWEPTGVAEYRLDS